MLSCSAGLFVDVIALASAPAIASNSLPPSPPRYGVHIVKTHIPMKDGVKLAVTLYMPDGAAARARFPALLEYLPYIARMTTRCRVGVFEGLPSTHCRVECSLAHDVAHTISDDNFARHGRERGVSCRAATGMRGQASGGTVQTDWSGYAALPFSPDPRLLP